MNSIFSFILFTFLWKNGPLNANNCHRPVQMMRIENNNKNTGGSHGLVVMGNDSYLKGCRFESTSNQPLVRLKQGDQIRLNLSTLANF